MVPGPHSSPKNLLTPFSLCLLALVLLYSPIATGVEKPKEQSIKLDCVDHKPTVSDAALPFVNVIQASAPSCKEHGELVNKKRQQYAELMKKLRDTAQKIQATAVSKADNARTAIDSASNMLAEASKEYRAVASEAKKIAEELGGNRKVNEDYVKKLHARHAELQRMQGVHEPAQVKDLRDKNRVMSQITGTRTDDPKLPNLRTQLQHLDARIQERDERFIKPLKEVVSNQRNPRALKDQSKVVVTSRAMQKELLNVEKQSLEKAADMDTQKARLAAINLNSETDLKAAEKKLAEGKLVTAPTADVKPEEKKGLFSRMTSGLFEESDRVDGAVSGKEEAVRDAIRAAGAANDTATPFDSDAADSSTAKPKGRDVFGDLQGSEIREQAALGAEHFDASIDPNASIERNVAANQAKFTQEKIESLEAERISAGADGSTLRSAAEDIAAVDRKIDETHRRLTPAIGMEGMPADPNWTADPKDREEMDRLIQQRNDVVASHCKSDYLCYGLEKGGVQRKIAERDVSEGFDQTASLRRELETSNPAETAHKARVAEMKETVEKIEGRVAGHEALQEYDARVSETSRRLGLAPVGQDYTTRNNSLEVIALAPVAAGAVAADEKAPQEFKAQINEAFEHHDARKFHNEVASFAGGPTALHQAINDEKIANETRNLVNDAKASKILADAESTTKWEGAFFAGGAVLTGAGGSALKGGFMAVKAEQAAFGAATRNADNAFSVGNKISNAPVTARLGTDVPEYYPEHTVAHSVVPERPIAQQTVAEASHYVPEENLVTARFDDSPSLQQNIVTQPAEVRSMGEVPSSAPASAAAEAVPEKKWYQFWKSEDTQQEAPLAERAPTTRSLRAIPSESPARVGLVQVEDAVPVAVRQEPLPMEPVITARPEPFVAHRTVEEASPPVRREIAAPVERNWFQRTYASFTEPAAPSDNFIPNAQSIPSSGGAQRPAAAHSPVNQPSTNFGAGVPAQNVTAARIPAQAPAPIATREFDNARNASSQTSKLEPTQVPAESGSQNVNASQSRAGRSTANASSPQSGPATPKAASESQNAAENISQNSSRLSEAKQAPRPVANEATSFPPAEQLIEEADQYVVNQAGGPRAQRFAGSSSADLDSAKAAASQVEKPSIWQKWTDPVSYGKYENAQENLRKAEARHQKLLEDSSPAPAREIDSPASPRGPPDSPYARRFEEYGKETNARALDPGGNHKFDRVAFLRRNNKEFTAITETDNIAYRKLAEASNAGQPSPVKRSVLLESAVTKELNDVIVKDKELVNSLLNLQKDVIWGPISRDPLLSKHLIGKYSDFKSMKFSFDTKNASIDARLKEIFTEFNTRYGAFLDDVAKKEQWPEASSLLSGKRENWHHLGIGNTPDEANWAARQSRQMLDQNGHSKPRTFEEVQAKASEELDAIEASRNALSAKYGDVEGMFVDAGHGRKILSAETSETIRKAPPGLVKEALETRFRQKFTDRDITSFKDYVNKADSVSPDLYLDKRVLIPLGERRNGIISADFKGQNARNLEETMRAMALTHGKSLQEQMRAIRKGEVAATKVLDAKKAKFREAVLKIDPDAEKHIYFSGDDGIYLPPRTLTEAERRQLLNNVSDGPDELRLTFNQSRYPDNNELIPETLLSRYVGEAEELEKSLRKKMIDSFPREQMNGLQLVVDMVPLSKGQKKVGVYLGGSNTPAQNKAMQSWIAKHLDEQGLQKQFVEVMPAKAPSRIPATRPSLNELRKHGDQPDGFIKETGGIYDLKPSARIEGSIDQGGLQPHYLADFESPKLAKLRAFAEEVGASAAPVEEKIRQITSFIQRKVLPRGDYDDPAYLKMLEKFRNAGKDIPLSAYVSCKAGVCRENALFMHYALKKAGVENKFVYAKVQQKVFRGNSMVFESTEDHAFTIVNINGENFIVDSYNSNFHGFSFDQLQSPDLSTTSSLRTTSFAENDPHVFRRVVQINHFPAVYQPALRAPLVD